MESLLLEADMGVGGVAALIFPTILLGLLYFAAFVSWMWDEFHKVSMD